MIYNDEFIWLHFPKCAGTKIEKLFSTYFSDQPDIVQDPTDIAIDPSCSWHDSIADRISRDPAFYPGERTIICSIRKLSPWLESRYSFEYQRSPSLPHRAEDLLDGKFLESNGSLNHADNYVKKYLPKSVLKSDKLKFLRTESFESDFKTIFSEFLNVSVIPDWEFKHHENATKNSVPTDIKTQLYLDHKKLYKKCPYWRLIEKIAYENQTLESIH